MNKYILLTLQLALIADQEYATTIANGASSLLQPNNFANLLTELSIVFAPTNTSTAK
jgi:hypothetical protein